MKAPRLRASPRHGSAVRVYKYSYRPAAGAAGFITNNYEKNNPHSHLFNLIFRGNLRSPLT
jgi:hypothetical protein